MDLVYSFLNLVLTTTSLIAFIFLLPPYLFFKFLSFLLRSTFSEDVAGKVVLITGASSGIGEHLAYEYAKRGAYLALAARRENRLREVAAVAESLGSPFALVIPADVSQIQDCKRCIESTVAHFGRLNHLVNNAGVSSINLFEEYDDLNNAVPIMDVNFWGMVYCTYYAIPHLKASRGKIIGIASSAAWLPTPRLSFYRASKAAVISFYETLRVEVGGEIGISIITPGLIESEMTRGKFMSKEGRLQLDQQLRDVVLSVMPVMPIGGAVKGILRSGCRGDAYATEPSWMRMAFYYATLCPELVEWLNRFIVITATSYFSTNPTPIAT
ncbi:11-beta-hydroxysteroid dehydrogenase 1B-like [Momordica charantia]|uniref:11-beta-hydroxysteroid dehydrogenase 1B-like n=1 Tax=Momordica charantia TaxID=3673 RepID=A0A6J1C9Q9_MOMCH|nr:11-beta-hydroxysteroid dehydrogenase 1B-like [Momordica charantia]